MKQRRSTMLWLPRSGKLIGEEFTAHKQAEKRLNDLMIFGEMVHRGQCRGLGFVHHQYGLCTRGDRHFPCRNSSHHYRRILIWYRLTPVSSMERNDESKFIDDIVRHISDRLFSVTPSDSGNFIGMDFHKTCMDSLLCLESDDVRMVGIWGMGGIGKTTVARFIFDKYSSLFQGCCFLENVKEVVKNSAPSYLQEKLLKSILLARDLRIWGSGSNVIKERLSNKKVLLVLDDVELPQLHTLAKSSSWFGPGSRVIITTRNKQVLEAHEVRHVYEVKGLQQDQALQLFRMFAFSDKQSMEDFLKVSTRAAKYADGLPLALQVLGSLFRPLRELAEWESTLSRLKFFPNMNIMKVLRVSYDALHEDEKIIFLYLSCFFNGESKDHVVRLLDGCSLPTDIVINTLIAKSLITLSKTGRLRMHGLLEEMGKDIVRQESINKPWKRKMLWNHEDIHRVLTQNIEAETVEAVFLNMSEMRDLYLSPIAFTRLCDLKLLSLYVSHGESKMHMPEGLQYLPNTLRYLRWDNYPLKSLPSRLQPEFLVELNMRYSHVDRLWEGIQPLMNLKVINLSRSTKLVEIPDLSKAKNLESLNLSFCKSLVEVPSSIRYLQKLTLLDLEFCIKLKSLPSNINLISLTNLYLTGCSRLKTFPEISMGIKKLNVHSSEIEEVPSSVELLSQLVELNMSGCKRLRKLPATMQNMKSLETVSLSNCQNITYFPEISTSITNIDLSKTAIEEVPTSISYLLHLTDLNMSSCTRLKNLPIEIHNLISLKYLYLDGCTNITKFPDIPGSIKVVNLSRTSIIEVPSSVGFLSLLELLFMRSCNNLKKISTSIFNLKSLEELDLSGCSNLENFPEILRETRSSVASLDSSSITYRKLSLFQYLRHHEGETSLKNLAFTVHLSNLKYLSFFGCGNLKSLPKSIKQMSSLEKLELSNCKGLESLPELPQCLVSLYAHDCTSLQTVPMCLKQLPDKKLIIQEQFIFSNCSNLDKDACNKIMENATRRIQQMGKQSKQEFFELLFLYKLCLPGDKVAEWFSYHSMRSSLTIELPLHWFSGMNMGFAFCIVVAFEHELLMHELDVSQMIIRCKYNIKAKSGEHKGGFSFGIWETMNYGPVMPASEHVIILCIDSIRVLNHYADDEYCRTTDEISFEFYPELAEDSPFPYCKVVSCGFHLLPKMGQIVSS